MRILRYKKCFPPVKNKMTETDAIALAETVKINYPECKVIAVPRSTKKWGWWVIAFDGPIPLEIKSKFLVFGDLSDRG